MDPQRQSRWQPTRRRLLWTGAAVALLTIAILIGYRYGVTLWDWIKLLIVPAVIAGGGFWFNAQQREREQELNAQQREREQELASERARDEALQAYLDQMSQLLLDKDRPLLECKEGDTVRTLARSRTLTVFPRLNDWRCGNVLLFLYKTGLITKPRPVIPLNGAFLLNVSMIDPDLRGADLSGAHLHSASLARGNLSEADLSEAGLTHAFLGKADLSNADLRRANLGSADLRVATLGGADLRVAYLKNADVTQADLRGANLQGANLQEVNLQEAAVTNEQLEQQARSLKGATMPNGQKYEDWLKRKNREEDG